MKKLILSAALLTATYMQAAPTVNPNEAYKAVLNLFAYDAQGKLLRSGSAFIVDAQGSAVTSFKMLQGARSAEVIDSKGKKYAVHRILGADATTDLVKFNMQGYKSNDYFNISEQPASKDDQLQLVRYTNGKKADNQVVKVTNDEAYNEYRYYQVSATNDPANITCPLTDNAGNLVAIVQHNVGKNATQACAIDARFIHRLSITAASAFNVELREIQIAKALPNEAKEALAYIYMLSAADTLACRTAYNDFVSEHPAMPDGYVSRAVYNAQSTNYAAAEADFKTAIGKAESDTTGMKIDAVHYNLSDLIYKLNITRTDSTPIYKDWDLARAEAEAAKAYDLSPHSLYLLQKGKCSFARGNYEQAYQDFAKVCEDKEFASADTYLSAAQALERTGRDSTHVMTLLDNCINLLPKPVSAQTAPYYWERALRYLSARRYREAVFDFNEYEKGVGPANLNENFYYMRHQAEMEAHMYQQAIDDIRTAIAIGADPLPYRMEEALILLRVGETKQAVDAAEQLLQALPENADCHKILGIGYGELGNKAKAREHLQKAQQLGDTEVGTLIEKYK